MFKGANYIQTKAGRIHGIFGYDAAKVLEVKSDDEITVYFYNFKALGETSPIKDVMDLKKEDLWHFLEVYEVHSIDGVDEIEKPTEIISDQHAFLLGLLLGKYREKGKLANVLGVSEKLIVRWMKGDKIPSKRLEHCRDLAKAIYQ